MEMGKEFFDSRPQHLCKMCGMCCRIATASEPYEVLLKLKQQGNKEAIDFLSIFKKYDSIEKAREVSNEQVEKILQGNMLSSDRQKNITFYYCKYLNDDNTCSIYEKRPNLCRRAPASPWMVTAINCGFNEWLKEVRKQKMEIIIELKKIRSILEQLDANTIVNSKGITAKQRIEEINKKIEPYIPYGANDW